MDKEFWAGIAKNDYKIPEDHTLGELTETLFTYLGDTDPELRDDIAYIVYANTEPRRAPTQRKTTSHLLKSA